MMRRILIAVIAIFTLSVKAQTKVYHPFSDSNAVWNISSLVPCGQGFDTWNHKYSITFSGDTIINSTKYHKLKIPVEVITSYGQCGMTGTWIIPGHFVGCVRQDSSTRKVFIIPPTASAEQLLYDFNMNVGDTAKGYLFSFGLSESIKSIDSVLVGTTYRKRWNINTCYGVSLIEGVGSTYGLIEKSPGCLTDMADYSITCFKQDGLTLYPNGTANCELITPVVSLGRNPNMVNIFPNPSTGSFTIDLDQPMNIKEIRLADLLGNVIVQQHTGNQSKIQINDLQGGAYILIIISEDNKTTTRKIVNCPQ